MRGKLCETAIVLVAALSIVGVGQNVLAQSSEPLCATDDLAVTATPDPADPLAGRLGGTREAFETRYGPPSEESNLSVSYELEGCGWLSVGYEEGIVTNIGFTTPNYLTAEQAEWSLAEAEAIAARVLPVDAEMGEPFRNVSFVEHRPCASATLAAQVPASVYSYVDTNSAPGQCSAVFEFDEVGDVLKFKIQLQVED